MPILACRPGGADKSTLTLSPTRTNERGKGVDRGCGRRDRDGNSLDGVGVDVEHGHIGLPSIRRDALGPDWARLERDGAKTGVQREIQTMSDTLLLLTLATENAELRAHLAEVQDQCVELAVDAGELHAEVEALRRELTEVRAERDEWCDRCEAPERSSSKKTKGPMV
ncbi:hypothetical protein [Methylobacterium sp. E-045]|uniref:hypothetical protein n=1 Tax=Methylobacterium sp. E-045 TaxID=2836575 RepID=UPI001FBBD2CE|nr:hypothetical protein [Methylobacterium sp. E-045]MCJ2127374.1 hypothetical protein [Methylobacterium sp. E-045]